MNYSGLFTLRMPALCVLLSLVSLLIQCDGAAEAPVAGGMVGEVDSASALFWARGRVASDMYVELRRQSNVAGEANRSTKSKPGIESMPGPTDRVVRRISVSAARDFTGRLRVMDLQPETVYQYRIWLEPRQIFTGWFFTRSSPNADGVRTPAIAVTGAFRTAPDADRPAPIKFVFGGDIAGQNVCRDAKLGFPIFAEIAKREPDFFIGLGDMIYADNRCEAVGKFGNSQIASTKRPAVTRADFWQHYRYLHADSHWRKLMFETPLYVTWDDHEVINDFGPLDDAGSPLDYPAGQGLMVPGLAAFLDYMPVSGETPLYRTIRHGKHIEIFLLDTRRYRDANESPDSSGKTMLGKEQLAWLKEALKLSDATYKIVATSVPLSIPTGTNAPSAGRDGWANFNENTGFESELRELLWYAAGQQVRNLIFITADVHFASVFRYQPFEEFPEFQPIEIVTGPLHAGLFPNREFDETLRPTRLFYYGPDFADSVTEF